MSHGVENVYLVARRGEKPSVKYTYAEKPISRSEKAQNLDPDYTYKIVAEVDHGNHSIKYGFNRRKPPGGKR